MIPRGSTTLSAAMRYRKMPETSVPIQPVTWCSSEWSFLTGPASDLDPDREQEREREHDRRVPEREPEPDAQRPLAFAHQLAGGVVDRGDVVGVEGVAHPERVGGDADPDRERSRRSEAVVWGRPARTASRSRARAGRRQQDHHQQHSPLWLVKRRPPGAAMRGRPEHVGGLDVDHGGGRPSTAKLVASGRALIANRW